MKLKLIILLSAVFAIILSSNVVLACITAEKMVSTLVDSSLDVEEFKLALEGLGFEPVLEEINGFSKITFIYGIVDYTFFEEETEFEITVSVYAKGDKTVFSIDSLKEEYAGGELIPEEQLKDVIRIAISKGAMDFPLNEVDDLEMVQNEMAGRWSRNVLICQNFNDQNPDTDCFPYTYKAACDGLEDQMPDCLQSYCAVCNESDEYLNTHYNDKMLGVAVPTCEIEIDVKDFNLSGEILDESEWLFDGALVRNPNASGMDQFDVYIIKIVGNKRFKRLILSSKIFSFYQHLNPDDVILIDQVTMDLYTTSNLVRVISTDEVYELYPAGDGGTKKRITGSGYDPDSIYTINKAECDEYTGNILSSY